MKKLHLIAGLLACGLAFSACAQAPKKVLVVNATLGFTHSCIPMAEKILTDLGTTSGAYTVVDYVRSGPRPQDKDKATEWEAAIKKDCAEKLSADAMKKYDAIIFCNTTGDLPFDVNALLDWIKNGGAFIGMHAASDTFHGSPAFIDMIGGEFKQHGAQVKVECINQDPKHPATSCFGPTFEVYDEIYQFKNFYRNRVHGLLTLDKHPNDKTPGDYPVSWCKQVGKGKVFYTSLGHREDVWDSEIYKKHVLGGIKWSLGLEPGSAVPQVK